MQKQRLLLVDDDPDVRDALARLVCHRFDRVEVRTAASVAEAITVGAQWGATCVLSDIDFGADASDGFDLAALLQDSAHIRVALMSGLITNARRERAAALGVELVQKPDVAGAILRLLGRVIVVGAMLLATVAGCCEEADRSGLAACTWAFDAPEVLSGSTAKDPGSVCVVRSPREREWFIADLFLPKSRYEFVAMHPDGRQLRAGDVLDLDGARLAVVRPDRGWCIHFSGEMRIDSLDEGGWTLIADGRCEAFDFRGRISGTF